MTSDSYYKAGRIIKAQGQKGILQVVLTQPELFEGYTFETVFVDPGGGLVPYFVQSNSFQPDKNLFLLQLEDVSNPGAVAVLVNKDIYIASDALPQASGTKFYMKELAGFAVQDEVYGNLGILEEVLELPMQRVFRIMLGKQEILIPAVPEFIININRENKILLLRAPDGLIDIYLSPLSGKNKEEEE